jgi:hypothetical protein
MQTNIEQDKREEIEVELPEEEKVETQPEQKETVNEESQQDEIKVEETKDNQDEVENYSVKVKSRIDKLTKRLREAERREEAAIAYAKGVQQEKEKIAGAYQKLDKNYIDDLSKSVDDRLLSAKEKLKSAITNRDVDAQISANELIAKLTIDRERIAYSRQQQEENVEEKPSEQEKPQVQQPTAPKPDPKAVEWANKNDWYGDDEVMTESAKAIHRELIRNGVDPTSEEYYNGIDKKIREYFPHKFSQEENVEIDSKPIQPVASTTRTNTKKAGRKVVRLTPSQVAMAKRLGVPINEYAKYVKEA